MLPSKLPLLSISLPVKLPDIIIHLILPDVPSMLHASQPFIKEYLPLFTRHPINASIHFKAFIIIRTTVITISDSLVLLVQSMSYLFVLFLFLLFIFSIFLTTN